MKTKPDYKLLHKLRRVTKANKEIEQLKALRDSLSYKLELAEVEIKHLEDQHDILIKVIDKLTEMA